MTIFGALAMHSIPLSIILSMSIGAALVSQKRPQTILVTHKNHADAGSTTSAGGGIAFLKASQHAGMLGLDQTTCLANAEKSWSTMDDNAPKVWEKVRIYPQYAEAAPRFEGGCWNNYFVPLSVCDPASRCNPLDKDGDPVCGCQNTVTNGLYLVLDARYYQQTGSSNPYLKAAAERERDWFNHWFFNSDLSPDEKLLASLNGGALARERVSTYTFYNGSYPPVRAYQKGFHWAGDQGIILGAMVDMARIDPDRANVYRAIARGILDGVEKEMCIGGILQPWIPAEQLKDYDEDYSTGVGVYMRYLLYAFLYDPVLNTYIMGAYKPFIQTNADSICDSQGKLTPCPRLPDGTSMDPRECLLNRLAMLNAAIVILGP